MIPHPICPYAGCNSPEGECLGVCCADSRGHTVTSASPTQAVAKKPTECASGCPKFQVCDYCQGAGGKDKQSLNQDISSSVAYAQSTPSLRFGYSTPEPQVQAGEPVTVGYSVTFNGDHVGNIFKTEQEAVESKSRWDKVAPAERVVHALITLQSHREAMAKQKDNFWEVLALREDLIAKKDAALKACVETLRRIAVLVPKDDAQVADAITQAQEALK